MKQGRKIIAKRIISLVLSLTLVVAGLGLTRPIEAQAETLNSPGCNVWIVNAITQSNDPGQLRAMALMEVKTSGFPAGANLTYVYSATIQNSTEAWIAHQPQIAMPSGSNAKVKEITSGKVWSETKVTKNTGAVENKYFTLSKGFCLKKGEELNQKSKDAGIETAPKNAKFTFTVTVTDENNHVATATYSQNDFGVMDLEKNLEDVTHIIFVGETNLDIVQILAEHGTVHLTCTQNPPVAANIISIKNENGQDDTSVARANGQKIQTTGKPGIAEVTFELSTGGCGLYDVKRTGVTQTFTLYIFVAEAPKFFACQNSITVIEPQEGFTYTIDGVSKTATANPKTGEVEQLVFTELGRNTQYSCDISYSFDGKDYVAHRAYTKDINGQPIMTTGSHVFDNFEDASCNVENCGYTRDVVNNAYELVELNNLHEDVLDPKHYTKPLDPASSDNRATLEVHLTDEADTFKVYKVAEVEFDSGDMAYTELAWVNEVQQFVAENGMSYYSSPLDLQTAYSSEMRRFYVNLMERTGNNVTLEPYSLPYYNAPGQEDTPVHVFTGTVEPGADPVISIPNMEIGQYVILAESGSQTFAPYVVTIVPVQIGPSTFYLQDVYKVYLKPSGADVVKYIVVDDDYTNYDRLNNSHMNTAALNQTQKMRLVVEMPTYRDRVTLSAGSVNPYRLTITDIMDESMKLVNKGASGDNDALAMMKSISVGYVDLDNNFHELPITNVNYIEFADSSYNGAKYPVTSEQSTTLADCYYVNRTGTLFNIINIYEQPSSKVQGAMEEGFVIDFNMAALKSYFKEMGSNIIPQFEVRYECYVTDKIRANSTDNINNVSIQFERNDDGSTMAEINDHVNLYTYGVNIHKLDGDTNTALADARFHLYKQVAEFRQPEGGAVSEINIVDEIYKSLEGYTTIPEFRNDGNYYIFEYGEAQLLGEIGEEDIEIITVTVTGIFQKQDNFGENGDFVTTVDAQGKNTAGNLFVGLREGRYILEEYQAPTGYNRLLDDMLFDIVRLSDEEAYADYGGNLKAFRNAEGEVELSGIYSIDILNYKGLVLPATGGMGTLLFTILGAFIMVGVVVVVIRYRRRYVREEFYE